MGARVGGFDAEAPRETIADRRAAQKAAERALAERAGAVDDDPVIEPSTERNES